MIFHNIRIALISFFTLLIKKPSFYLFGFLLIFSLDRHHRYECSVDPENGPFYSDVFEYYSFLPEYFLNFQQVPEQNVSTTKRTVGMAIMYAPAFFVGHAIAIETGEVDDGYSPPYHWSIRWGSIIYCLLGLFFCHKNLLLFFKEPIAAVTVLCVFFGTNLFFYTYGWGELPHSYLFFLYSAFIYNTLKWISGNSAPALMWMGILAGMIVLIRPSGILVILFPILFGVTSKVKLRQRFKQISQNPMAISISFVLFLLPLIFQLLIWKKFVGHYIHYSYNNERFFFNDPQIYNFLLSFRKGWLIYTPMMAFSLLGIVLSVKLFKDLFVFISMYFLVSIYILSSWWEWSYGGSLGCRALIESYAFLSFPFAVFLNWIWNLNKVRPILNSITRLGIICVFYFLIQLNLFQTWQYKYGLIHYSGMNKKTYKYIFMKTSFSRQERLYLETLFTPPNAQAMMRGERDE
ncbi:MAG: hypothetical protein PSX36_09265 [bacterium]|nr:hypothetical protein [bacterium]